MSEFENLSELTEAGVAQIDRFVNGAKGTKFILTSLDDFLAIKDDRPIVEVPVPEWDGKIVLMRAMAAIERDEWEYRYIKDQHIEPDEAKRRERDRRVKLGDRLIGSRAQLAARCIVNPQGEPIFTAKDVAMLQQRNAAAINRLADKASELCGFTEADQARLEQAKKDNASPDDEPSSD